MYDDGGAWGSIESGDTESGDAEHLEYVKEQPVRVKLYHCWACDRLSSDSSGFCHGMDHQRRQSRCDSKPVTNEYVDSRVFYYSRRLGVRTEGWHKACSAAMEDELHKLKLMEQLDAVRDQIAGLKMQERNLKAELWELHLYSDVTAAPLRPRSPP